MWVGRDSPCPQPLFRLKAAALSQNPFSLGLYCLCDWITMRLMRFSAPAPYSILVCVLANLALGNSIVVERPDNSCPRIVTRDEWRARNATGVYQDLKISPAPYVVVHHGGILHYCYDQPECSQVVRSYQDLHIDDRGWIDIGYNFVIGEDGNVYEGRGWGHVGAHAPGYNSQSIGVSIVGDFSHFIPNRPAIAALESLIACGLQLGKISNEYNVIGHRQVRDTVCPGEVFYGWVQTMPRWTDKPVPVFSNESRPEATSRSSDENDNI